jgi:hypothetical protein
MKHIHRIWRITETNGKKIQAKCKATGESFSFADDGSDPHRQFLRELNKSADEADINERHQA